MKAIDASTEYLNDMIEGPGTGKEAPEGGECILCLMVLRCLIDFWVREERKKTEFGTSLNTG